MKPRRSYFGNAKKLARTFSLFAPLHLCDVCATARRRVKRHLSVSDANPYAMSDRRSRSESLSTAPVGTKLAAFASIGKPAEKPALTHIQSKWKPVATAATIGNYARRRAFDKNAAGLPAARSVTELP